MAIRPNLETWAHAERDRQRARDEMRIAAQESAARVAASGFGTSTTTTAMSILGGGSGTWGGTWVSDGCHPSPPPSSIPPSSIIAVDADGYASLKVELEEAKRTIAEQAEIIEALAADGDELDSLRAENEKLRAELFERVPHKSSPGEWISWHGEETVDAPPDGAVEVRLREHGDAHGPDKASRYRWNHTGRGSRDADIVAYRVIG